MRTGPIQQQDMEAAKYSPQRMASSICSFRKVGDQVSCSSLSTLLKRGMLPAELCHGSHLFHRWKAKAAFNWLGQQGWQDLDNDGLVNKTAEVFKIPSRNSYSFFDTDHDFNVYSQRIKMSPRIIDANGVPRYDGSLILYVIFDVIHHLTFRVGTTT